MAFETSEQFWAAMMEEQRLQTALFVDIRDHLSGLLARADTAPASSNGHAKQMPLGGPTNGAQRLPRGVTYDASGHPAFVAGHTLDDGRRVRIRVTKHDWSDDAFDFACIVLEILKGRDRERNLAKLPEKLRMKVMLALLPTGRQ